MATTRPFIRWFLAFVLAAFAVPGFAAQPEKKWSIDVIQGAAVAPGIAEYKLRLTNETPNGNSNINSFTVTLPSGFTIKNSVSPAYPAPFITPASGSVVGADGTATVTLTNLSPVKPLASIVLTLWADNTGATSCTGLTWGGTANTGSGNNGDPFRLLSQVEEQALTPPKSRTTTLATGLALQFLPLSGPVVQDTSFDVSVKLTSACGTGTTLPNTKIFLAGSSGYSGETEELTNGGQATFSGSFANLGPASLTASATGFAGATLNLTVFEGTLKCEPQDPYQFTAPTTLDTVVDDINATGYSKGARGPFNKDGVACAPIGYTFTNDILDNNSVSLTWDLSGDQKGAAFEYTAVWKPEYVNATSGLPTRVTKVKWVGLATAVNAKACIGPNLPEPYGTLNGAIDNVQTSITVTLGSVAAPPVPFAINVGNERMQVTAIDGAGTGWTVARSQGGTIAPVAGWASGKSVMSNPLPLDASGNQMQMCIVQETWFTVLPGDADCAVPDSSPGTYPPRACVRVRTTIFDIGDGFVIRGGG